MERIPAPIGFEIDLRKRTLIHLQCTYAHISRDYLALSEVSIFSISISILLLPGHLDQSNLLRLSHALPEWFDPMIINSTNNIINIIT